MDTCPLCNTPMVEFEETTTLTTVPATSTSEYNDAATVKMEEPPVVEKTSPEPSPPPERPQQQKPRVPVKEKAPLRRAPAPETRKTTRITSGAQRIQRAQRMRNYASLGERVLAFGFDLALLVVLSAGAEVLALYISGALSTLSAISYPEMLKLIEGVFAFFFGVMAFFYFTIFHGLCGQTPGKMIFEIMVVDRMGDPPGIEKAAFRFFCYALSTAPLLAGFIMILFSSTRQALHDRLSSTEVVRV